MTAPPRRLIWFCDAERLAARLDSLGRLQEAVGLTTVMPEDHRFHTSGFRASAALDAASPFADWPQRPALAAHRQTHGLRPEALPVLPGLVGGADDRHLIRLREACRRLGLECWGHLGLWSYGADLYPEYAMQDIDGRPPDLRYRRWGIGFCPSRRALHDWLRQGLVEATRTYGLDGWWVDHARYPPPANVASLFACACDDCRLQAVRLGYDFQALAAAARTLRATSLVPGATEAEPWFRFRAHLLADRLADLRLAVRQAADRPIAFGFDVFPPSVALWGGHDYPALARAADYFTGGSSFGGVVGWATVSLQAAAQWLRFLLEGRPQTDPGAALRSVYRLFGIDDLDLPLTLEGLEAGPWPLGDLFHREVRRIMGQAPAGVPVYPPVSAGAEPALLRRLCRLVAEGGAPGLTLSGLDPHDDERLRLIADSLPPVP